LEVVLHPKNQPIGFSDHEPWITQVDAYGRADVALQQGSTNVMAVDKGKPSRGRKIPGSEMDYVSRFSARFAYQDFDPQAVTNIVVFFPDGKLVTIEADFSKIK